MLVHVTPHSLRTNCGDWATIYHHISESNYMTPDVVSGLPSNRSHLPSVGFSISVNSRLHSVKGAVFSVGDGLLLHIEVYHRRCFSVTFFVDPSNLFGLVRNALESRAINSPRWTAYVESISDFVPRSTSITCCVPFLDLV